MRELNPNWNLGSQQAGQGKCPARIERSEQGRRKLHSLCPIEENGPTSMNTPAARQTHWSASNHLLACSIANCIVYLLATGRHLVVCHKRGRRVHHCEVSDDNIVRKLRI